MQKWFIFVIRKKWIFSRNFNLWIIDKFASNYACVVWAWCGSHWERLFAKPTELLKFRIKGQFWSNILYITYFIFSVFIFSNVNLLWQRAMPQWPLDRHMLNWKRLLRIFRLWIRSNPSGYTYRYQYDKGVRTSKVKILYHLRMFYL